MEKRDVEGALNGVNVPCSRDGNGIICKNYVKRNIPQWDCKGKFEHVATMWSYVVWHEVCRMH